MVQNMKFHLDNQQPISNNLEMLKTQLEQLEVSIIYFLFLWYTKKHIDNTVQDAIESPNIKREIMWFRF